MEDKEPKVDIFEMILKPAGEPYVFDPKKLGKHETVAALAELSRREVEDDWQIDHQEGQLSVDVINTEKDLIILSTMAGAEAAEIEVYIHNDLLTIKGKREMPLAEDFEGDFLHQECFWGKFSRTVVLPVDVRGEAARAKYENGVLQITIPKRKVESRIKIKVVDE